MKSVAADRRKSKMWKSEEIEMKKAYVKKKMKTENDEEISAKKASVGENERTLSEKRAKENSERKAIGI